MSTSKRVRAKGVKKRSLIFSTAIVTSLIVAGQVVAQEKKAASHYDIPAQPLEDSLNAFAMQADVELLYTSDDVRAIEAPAISGAASREQAIAQLLAGTGLIYRFTDSGTLIVQAPDKTSANAARAGRIEMAQVAQRRSAAASVATIEELQDDDVDNGQQDRSDIVEMVVTGSSIRGIAPDSSPLFILDREGIDRAGFSTVEQLIEALPQNFGGGIAVDTFSVVPESLDAAGNFSRGTSANLRGLGSDATLVLVNGRRLAPTTLSAFVDISAIPLSAIERVEVLTDGASAIYGSDAVAGVINFVLRDDYDGAETLLRYGAVSGGSLDEYKASQTFGKNWGSGNALFVYEFFNQDSLPASDRDFALDAGVPPDFDLLPQVERHNVFASISQQLTDRVELFASGLYTNREVESLSSSVGFPLAIGSDTEQFNLSGGGTIDVWAGWVLEVAGSYGQDEALIDNEFVTFGVATERKLENTLWTIDAKADGPVFELPGGEIKLAVGMSYRDEKFDDIGITSEAEFSVDRDVFAAYGELFIPLVSEKNRLPGVERFEISVAGRFEDYSDFGSSTDPKVGALWSPVAGLNLRGTYSTSFRAPNLNDLNANSLETFLANAFDPDAAGGTSLALVLFGNTGGLNPEESTAWTAGVDYEPQFLPGLSLSVTYYDIEFDDRIDIPSTNSLLPVAQPDVFAPILTVNPTAEEIASTLALTPAFRNFTLIPGFGPPGVPEDTEVIVDNTLQNISITNTSGLDFLVSYSLETTVGDFGFGLNGTYIFDFERAITETAPLVDLVDTVFNPADFRIRANANWSHSGFTASVFLNHTGGYTDNVVVPEADVDSWTTADVTLSFDTQERFNSRFLNNVRLALSVQNIFDEDPPTIQATAPGFNSIGYDPANAAPLNRFVAVQITKAW